MKTRDYIILPIIFLVLLYASKFIGNNDYSVLFDKIIEREQFHQDSLQKLRTELESLENQKVIDTRNHYKVDRQTSQYFEKPIELTKKDTSDCFHLIGSLNTCNSLLLNYQKTSSILNRRNDTIISNLKRSLTQKDGIISTKDDANKLLMKRNGGLYFGIEVGGNSNNFNNLSAGATYVFKKKPILIDYRFNFVEKTNNVGIKFNPFK